ncbi:MAG: hypothetical protein LKI58_03655 [Actinomyces sp.]|jgi:hypothetical protein|nr:hypothetical protein [Actinomyces sp.]MCI1787152.1 hypothetical protein [Actinomyces sp.]MCI1829546.1 hypothetical protein [Actinomyces sp.]MCI1866586.1 hypothetical protein [Actinomyces sp.]
MTDDRSAGASSCPPTRLRATAPQTEGPAVVLIPVFRPGQRLVDLVGALRRSTADPPVVVVDDGSAPGRRGFLDAARAAGAEVVVRSRHGGRRRALRTGLAHVVDVYPGRGVIAADADGRSTVDDILCVGAVLARMGRITLAVREASDGTLRRRHLGDAAASLAAGRGRIADAPTGLCGVPADQVAWLSTAGASRLGLALAGRRSPVVRVPIRLPAESRDSQRTADLAPN